MRKIKGKYYIRYTEIEGKYGWKTVKSLPTGTANEAKAKRMLELVNKKEFLIKAGLAFRQTVDEVYNFFAESENLINYLNSPIEAPAFQIPKSIKANQNYIKEYNGVSGVYFLIDSNEIVYVGQSVNVHARINTHFVEQRKDFDRAVYIPIPKEYLDKIENAFICHLKPKYNKWKYSKMNMGRTTEAVRILNELEPLAQSFIKIWT